MRVRHSRISEPHSAFLLRIFLGAAVLLSLVRSLSVVAPLVRKQHGVEAGIIAGQSLVEGHNNAVRLQVVEDADRGSLGEARLEWQERSDKVPPVAKCHGVQAHRDTLGLGLVLLSRRDLLFTFGWGCR